MLKYKITVLCLFLLAISGISYVQASSPTLPLFGKVIYLDPGHGGLDPGAIYKDLEEEEINLEISTKLASNLEKLGAIVYLTRTGDYDLAVPNTINRKRSDLSRRANIINRSKCDLYLSLHLNAETSSTWKGAQVFYDDVNEENQKIAEIMQKSLAEKVNTKREFKEMTTIYMYQRINQPGVLIELGFLSNPNERYLLTTDTHQQKLIDAIIDGTRIYFNT